MSAKSTAAAVKVNPSRRAVGIGFLAGLASTGAVAATAGAADTCTGGGGQVISPSRTTVTERCTTSSQSRVS